MESASPVKDITESSKTPCRIPTWLKGIAAFDIILWCLGAMLSEALSQGAEALAILLTIAGAFLPTDTFDAPLRKPIRIILIFCFGLTLWQIATPLLALALGHHPSFPKGSKFCQFFDTAALGFLICVTRFGVPWKAIGGIVATGWLGHGIAAILQHFGMWPDALLSATSFKANPARLHENFGAANGPVRHAGLGLYYHRLKLAHHGVAFFGTAIAIAIAVAKRFQVAKFQRCSAAILSLVIATALWFTYARAALGAILAIFALAFLLTFKKKAILPVLAICLLATVLVAVLPSWQQRFSNLSGTWIGADRRFAWTAASTLAREHPIIGVGFGNYQSALKLRIARPTTPSLHATPSPHATLSKAPTVSPFFNKALSAQSRYLNTELITLDGHNLFLTVFAETGLIGLILFTLLHFSLAATLWKKHRQGFPIATGALLAWVGFHILGIVHYLPFHTGVHLAFSFVWALGLSENQPLGPCDASQKTPSAAASKS